jgi:hypothetical protein
MKDKEPLTYTVGDTAFGQVLQKAAQKARAVGDKKSEGRHHPPRKAMRPMATQTQQNDVQSKSDVTPSGGPSKARAALETSKGIAIDTAALAGKTVVVAAVGTATGALTYWGLKSLGVPLP